jgi:hypothetical protein
MINPAAPIFIFLGLVDLALVTVPDLRLCVAGGVLTSILACLTILRTNFRI